MAWDIYDRENMREWVFRKTDGMCWYCGCELSFGRGGNDLGAPFVIEHQLPKIKGGSDHIDNLVPACRSCNSTKGPRTVSEYRQWLREKSVGLPPLTPAQLRWFLARGIDVEMMVRSEMPRIIFYGERIEIHA